MANVTGKFLNNARWAAASQMISGGLGLVALVLAKLLGADSYGLLVMTVSVLTFARIIGGSGLGQSTGKHLANLTDEERGAKAGSYLAAGFIAQIGIGLVLAFLIWFNSGRLALYFHTPKLAPSLRIAAIIMVFFSLTEFSKACVKGLQRFDYQALITGIELSGKFVFAVGLTAAGFGLAGALVGYAAALALASLVACMLFIKSGMVAPRLESSEWRSLLGYSLPLIFTSAGFVIYTELDNIMIFYYLGAGATGAYSIAMTLARAVPFIAAPIGAAAAPLVAQLYQAKDERTADFVHHLIRYVVAAFFPVAVALFVLAPRILALFGEEFVLATPALRVMSVFVLSMSMATVTVPMLDYLGQAGPRAVRLTISVSANVLLNFLLIPRYGIAGAAVATAITHTPYMLNNVSSLAKIVGLNKGAIFLSLARIFAASAAAGVLAAPVLYWTNSLILTVIWGAAAYAALLLLVGAFSPPEIGWAFEQLRMGAKAPISSE